MAGIFRQCHPGILHLSSSICLSRMRYNTGASCSHYQTKVATTKDALNLANCLQLPKIQLIIPTNQMKIMANQMHFVHQPSSRHATLVTVIFGNAHRIDMRQRQRNDRSHDTRSMLATWRGSTESTVNLFRIMIFLEEPTIVLSHRFEFREFQYFG